MKYLFVNNIRGFSSTYIPILDVNFFVGENSTGKTSILSLLKILSSPGFWFHQDFSVDDVSFSHFKDIVSAASSDKKCFDIGLIQIKNDVAIEEKKTQAFLMTFIEREGIPNLSILTYLKGNYCFRIRFGKTIIKYKYNKLNNLPTGENFIQEIYQDWIQNHRTDTRGYTTLKSGRDQIIPGALPLMVLPSIIEDITLKTVKKKRELPFRGLSPSFFVHEIAWLAPIRTKPKRTYDSYKIDFSPEGDHTPYLIKKIVEKDKKSKKFKRFIAKIGSDSGLFEGVSVKRYGKGATSPFELDIILNDNEFNICNVGYGVSQSLPVIVELFIRKKNTWYAIQQPEVHLHPKAQASLGDIFFQLAVTDKKKFLIETHSDYTIDRFRINYRDRNKSEFPSSQVLFFERHNTGNSVHQLKIDDDGELPIEQPKSYREFFVKEEMIFLDL